ncbi:uncharacterized protein METZ01_LOCUS175610 [marine metagenome]|uniref:Sialidase domain-containing protein n=1 Tax=marine metagenome TaxID=408172 RepID=A0A382C9J9_9ZZZZ
MPVNRRTFIQHTTALAASGAAVSLLAKPSEPAPLHLLSKQGCGRASGYAEANKIITAKRQTHVAWIDSAPEGFRVRVATLNRATGKWSPTYTIGQAKDNHGGPALTIDSEGYLHIAYFPHHDPFRYRRSKRPHDASEWEEEIQFGERLTYPTMICGADNTLYFTARRSFSDRPWFVELWEKKPGHDWHRVGPVMHSRHKGYAHFQESLGWGPDHKTIHLCCRFHELSDKSAYGRLQTVAYMKSEDFGRTWKRSNGSVIRKPVTVDNIETIARGGVDLKKSLRAGCMAVSPKGQPYLLYSTTAEQKGEAWLATPDGKGRWNRRRLNDHLPPEWRSFNLIMAGGLSFDHQGRLHGVGQLQTGDQNEKIWGDPTNEIVTFTVVGKSDIQFRAISKFDPKTSHWLPNIERSTGHNTVPSLPSVLFTGGAAGKANTDLLKNRVYFGR